MVTMVRGGGRTDFSAVIGLVLRYGVVVSFMVICLGSILLFSEGQTGYYPVGTEAGQLFGGHGRFLIGIVPMFQGVAAAKPYAIIDLGLLILFATPIARVFVSIFLFLDERRYVFVIITVAVLALLLFSTFVLGPVIANGG
jgi:uncharacterized membrane protein